MKNQTEALVKIVAEHQRSNPHCCGVPECRQYNINKIVTNFMQIFFILKLNVTTTEPTQESTSDTHEMLWTNDDTQLRFPASSLCGEWHMPNKEIRHIKCHASTVGFVILLQEQFILFLHSVCRLRTNKLFTQNLCVFLSY